MAQKHKNNKKEIIFNEGNRFLLLISFVEGAVVMALELAGAKMITPYFGASLYVWSSVLAVTMFGLTTGYFLGGVISEKYDKQNHLYHLLIGASLLSCAMPLVAPSIMNLFLDFDFRIAAIASSLLFITPPIICCGMISPILIKKLSKNIEGSGDKTGNVYAFSTVGGILMTLIAGFYLIPEIGLRYTTVLSGLLLAIFVIYYYIKTDKTILAFLFGLCYFLFSFANVSVYTKQDKTISNFNNVYSTNGLLGHINVIDYKANQTRALFNNNISQSYMHIPTGRSQWTYVHRLATYTAFKPVGSEVLLVGLGAGNVINEFNLLKFQVDVCDIEKRTAFVAKKYFGMTNPRNIIIDDARHAINTNSNKYDLVVLDVSAGETQPNNLYTTESFESIKKILKNDGVLFIHYPTMMNGEEVMALKSICKTLEASKYHVNLINTGDNPDVMIEQLVVASLHDFDLEKQSFERRDKFALPFNFTVDGNFMRRDFDFSDGYILTDDKPIMDELHYAVTKRHRTDGINVTVKSLLKAGIKMF